MFVKIYQDSTNIKDIQKVVDVLHKGGVIIYPTDTVYGLGCSINKPKAVERIARIKKINLKKANFTFVCTDLSHLADYTKHVNTNIYKLMKKNLPGPFTFVLDASSKVPKLFKSTKKTVGIRVPSCNIAREIVKELGNPIMSTSIYDDDDILEYTTDPELIYEKYHNLVDMVIDGGYGDNEPSTVVDCTGDEIEIIREGKGILIQ